MEIEEEEAEQEKEKETGEDELMVRAMINMEDWLYLVHLSCLFWYNSMKILLGGCVL